MEKKSCRKKSKMSNALSEHLIRTEDAAAAAITADFYALSMKELDHII